MKLCNKENFSNIQIPTFLFLITIPSLVQNKEYRRRFFTKELLLLWNDSGVQIRNLNVHRATNTIFFCFDKPLNFDSQIAFYNLETKETQTVRGISKGCANAIDQDNDVIYLGGLKGIFKYNMETKNPEFFAEKDIHIKSLFFNERLYYIRSDKKVFTEFNGEFAHLYEFMDRNVDHFLVSKEGIIYYSIDNNFYIYDVNNTQKDLNILKKTHTVNAISEDNVGEVYLCTNRGVFTVLNDGLMKFMNQENILGLTADRDNNLILADSVSLFRLRNY